MAWGFDDFKKYLKITFSKRTDLENIDSENLYETWINAAYRDLTTRTKFWALKKEFYFPELFTPDVSQSTSDGVAYIDVPSDCLYIVDVYDATSKVQLDWMSWGWYRSQTDRADTAKEDNPTKWHRHGDYIYLHKTPDTIYSMDIDYKKRVTDLTGTGETVIGPEWDEVILTLARVKGFSWLRDWDQFERFKEEFMEQAANLVGIYDREERLSRREVMKPDHRYYHKKRY